jgi:hypothetical protein
LEGADVVNWSYIVLTFLAVAMSAFVLWYIEKPEVRVGLLRTEHAPAKA